MISVVVCSKNKADLNRFTNSLEQTIGVQFELVVIESPLQQPKGICTAYNEGITKTKFDFICFCHEDILFETQDWGKELINLLNIPAIGIAGVAGATYKSAYPTNWASVPETCYRINMVQQIKDGSSVHYARLDEGKFSETVVVDGCFIAGRREVFNEFKWNDDFLKGFHLYDIDISLRVRKKYKVVVANHISLAHLSEGNMNSAWLQESERFHQYYKNILPVSTKQLDKAEAKSLKYFTLSNYISILISLNAPAFKIGRFLLAAIYLYPFKKQNLYLLKRFIILGK